MPIPQPVREEAEKTREVSPASAQPFPDCRSLKKHFVAFFAAPVALYILAFGLVRLPAYSQWSRIRTFRPLDFAFRAQAQSADVVIFGDSSAYLGIDPSQMSAAMGITALTLPANVGELLAIGDLPLRHYLTAHKSPRVLVFYLAPWNFNSGDQGLTDPDYAGIEMLMRHGNARKILSFLSRHPFLAGQFPFMFYRANSEPHPEAPDFFQQQAAGLAATNGHEALSNPRHLDSDCKIPPALFENMRFGWADKMRKTYETRQTAVVVFAAPIPACVNARELMNRWPPGAPAAPPKMMPAGNYAQDTFYIHLISEGVPQATRDLIEAVRPLLALQ